MRFKVDENLPVEVKRLLVAHGHDAHTVIEEGLVGSEDGLIYRVAQDEGRIVVTLDLDFSDIRTYVPSQSRGIVVLRPGSQDKESVLALLGQVIPLFETEEIEGRLWIVGEDRVRIRD